VLSLLEEMSHSAYPGARTDDETPGDPDLDPVELHESAAASAQEARADYAEAETGQALPQP
jgi:cyanophycin synthetase